MSRKSSIRKRTPKKEPMGPAGLPASIAWSTIAALIFIGVIQEFGRFQPTLDTTFGFTSIILILCGTAISIGVFKLSRKKDQHIRPVKGPGQQEQILNSEIQAWYISVISPVENLLARRQWNPNYITSLSFCFSLVGCVFLYIGWLFLAGWMILLGGTLDILDGRIARKTGRVSRQGAFFDSVLDRYGELMIFFGLAAHYRDSLFLFTVILLSLMGSLMVSYTRARAEGLGVTCKMGLMQRPERVVLLGFGAIFSSILYMLRGTLGGTNFGPYLMGFVLILIAILSNYTALFRLRYVMRELKTDKENK